MQGCIFCKIIEGHIPAYTIAENNQFKVILDAFPSSEGHVLIVSKAHIENVFDMDSSLAGEAHTLAAHVAKAVSRTLQCDGVNILQNNGTAAGQTVFHYHIHVIPRFSEDKIQFKWPTQKLNEETFKSMRDRLSALM